MFISSTFNVSGAKPVIGKEARQAKSLPLGTYKPLGGDRGSQKTNYKGKEIVVSNIKKIKQENKRRQGMSLRESGQERHCTGEDT